MKFAHDAKLKGKWTLGRESHSTGIDLDRLEEWANKNLMKDKHKALHLGEPQSRCAAQAGL